jgi:NAD(P)-dependent dehydrogenase (short-subunit alcohol dehydrogenase family)
MWDKVMNINLKGPFFCSQAVGKQMIKQKCGKIINIASIVAHVAVPFQSAYASSKGGVLQLTKVLAVEWAKYNINVNVVSPGMTETPLTSELIRKNPEPFLGRIKRIPLRRINKPQDIANAVLFLASPESDNITGHALIVDGGVYALQSAHIWPEE